MLYIAISPEEHDRLCEERKHTSDAAWYRRLKIIQLSSQRTPVPRLAMLFDLCQATVRDYLTRYQAGGLDVLKRQSSRGAPRTHVLDQGGVGGVAPSESLAI
jgi:hypothetical protein